jgi:NADPH:quinone reductase-like Zn-dependent oxidoreductase
MKAIGIMKFGGPEVFEIIDLPIPEINENEVLIKVKAAAVNPVDWKSRRGNISFLTGKNFPFVLGTEVAGVVEKTGSKVTGLNPGQRVYAGLSYKGGGYAEYVKVNAEKVFLIPDNTSFVVASTYGVAGVTALQGLVLHGKLEEGMHVLINGASGGVGTYAVQIAKILGARVTAVCSAKNIELVKSLGADEVIDYNQNDFTRNKDVYDIIFDAVGKKSFASAKQALKKKGVYVNPNPRIKLFITQFLTSLTGGKKARGILLKMIREDLKWVRDQIAINNIKVIIDKTYPMTEVQEAHRYSESGRVRGKIVLTFD